MLRHSISLLRVLMVRLMAFFCVSFVIPWCSLRIEKPNEVISPTMTVISCRVILAVCFSFYICYVQILCATLYGIRQVFLGGHSSHCDMQRYSWRRVYVTTTAMNIPVQFCPFLFYILKTSCSAQVHEGYRWDRSIHSHAQTWLVHEPSNLCYSDLPYVWTLTANLTTAFDMDARSTTKVFADYCQQYDKKMRDIPELWPHINEPASFFAAMVDVHPQKKKILQLLFFFFTCRPVESQSPVFI